MNICQCLTIQGQQKASAQSRNNQNEKVFLWDGWKEIGDKVLMTKYIRNTTVAKKKKNNKNLILNGKGLT